jgi:hypothetical protein
MIAVGKTVGEAGGSGGGGGRDTWVGVRVRVGNAGTGVGTASVGAEMGVPRLGDATTNWVAVERGVSVTMGGNWDCDVSLGRSRKKAPMRHAATRIIMTNPTQIANHIFIRFVIIAQPRTRILYQVWDFTKIDAVSVGNVPDL